MKALVSIQTSQGYAEVGSTHRRLASHLKTEAGAIRFAKKFAYHRGFRIEFFTDDNFYGDPYKTLYFPKESD